MVDGDQLNVVVEEVIVKIAERNIKQYDVIPLFYDAAKAPPEQISKAAQFNGLKRAHLYSNIGEISNMLTRLWNRDNPDRHVAALLTALNNWRIDGAKTGAVNEYTNYPDVEKRVNKATGGPNGRLPYFFQFSKNGRRDNTTNKKKKRKWAKQNNSTMNRICNAFSDIGNINMNWAGIPPFNWEMVLSEPCPDMRADIVSEFCDLSNIKVSPAIRSAEESPSEKDLIDNNTIIDDHITETLTQKFGSIEVCFPHITKFLFTDEGASKAAHKQTYWRVFGNIAVNNLKANLEKGKYEVCPDCNAKYPIWSAHTCLKSAEGFYLCKDCKKLCQRTNSRQERCHDCQIEHRKIMKEISRKKTEQERKERARTFVIFSQSLYKKT